MTHSSNSWAGCLSHQGITFLFWPGKSMVVVTEGVVSGLIVFKEGVAFANKTRGLYRSLENGMSKFWLSPHQPSYWWQKQVMLR